MYSISVVSMFVVCSFLLLQVTDNRQGSYWVKYFSKHGNNWQLGSVEYSLNEEQVVRQLQSHEIILHHRTFFLYLQTCKNPNTYSGWMHNTQTIWPMGCDLSYHLSQHYNRLHINFVLSPWHRWQMNFVRSSCHILPINLFWAPVTYCPWTLSWACWYPVTDDTGTWWWVPVTDCPRTLCWARVTDHTGILLGKNFVLSSCHTLQMNFVLSRCPVTAEPGSELWQMTQ